IDTRAPSVGDAQLQRLSGQWHGLLTLIGALDPLFLRLGLGEELAPDLRQIARRLELEGERVANRPVEPFTFTVKEALQVHHEYWVGERRQVAAAPLVPAGHGAGGRHRIRARTGHARDHSPPA